MNAKEEKPEPQPICTGNCKLVGFIVEYCETCGLENVPNDGGDQYDHLTPKQ